MKFKLLIFVLLLACFSTLDFIGKSSKKDNMSDRSRMVIAVDTLLVNYSISKGEPTGYQLELLNIIAEKFKMPFEMLPIADRDERLNMLQNGTVDIAIFSDGLDSVSQLLSAHKGLCSSIAMDDKIKSVWVVRNGDEQFISDINVLMAELKETRRYKLLQKRYFEHEYVGRKGKISAYDHLFKRYSAEINWDWRLLAALSYQESKFNPAVQSRQGAYGLMQVLPTTAKYVGVDDFEHPENNIRAGVKFLKWTKRQLDKEDIPDEKEQLKFLLSAYNAGIGRIEDCRNFARSQGKDASMWDEIKQVIPLMSDPEHYEGEYIKRGRFKGTETINYVEQVLERYQYYKNTVAL